MKFKHPHKDHSQIDSFITLKEKNFPFLSFIYQIISKKPTFVSPNSAQTLFFPLKNTTSLLITTEENEELFADVPHTHFLSKLKKYFYFMEILPEKPGSYCSVLVRNNISHMTTLPTGLIGYIEISITTVKTYTLSM